MKVDKSTSTQVQDVAVQAQGPAELAQRATKPRPIAKKCRGRKMTAGKATQMEKPSTSEVAIQVRKDELYPLMGPQTYPSSPMDSSDDEFYFVLPED
ncbi:hypothetical protein TKK_0013516 [Trichogramma kaykai]